MKTGMIPTGLTNANKPIKNLKYVGKSKSDKITFCSAYAYAPGLTTVSGNRAEDTLFISILHQKSVPKRYQFMMLNICISNDSATSNSYLII
ncbi:hypothetical protein V5036_04365 [Enterobacter cloacae]|uniref:hypothetical protein n=1 Tax=Enterobacter cloacae TaxID=550 RepID=UPI0030767DF2